MTFYNVINAASMQGGQPEDVSQVLANFNAIAGILNGALDNNNLAPNASIDPTKLVLPFMGRNLGWSKGSLPPASPSDGDLWLLPADTTNGVDWLFRYNAGSASTYKWEFIGGSPISANFDGAEGIVAVINSWTDATTVGPSITVPRAGDYAIAFTMQCYHPAAAQANAGVGVSVNGGALAATFLSAFTLTGWNNTMVGTATGRGAYNALPASANVYLRYQQSATGLIVRGRLLAIQPIRIA